jgi:Raf kinase inhibitor-like YbhB/YbcL family protein
MYMKKWLIVFILLVFTIFLAIVLLFSQKSPSIMKKRAVESVQHTSMTIASPAFENNSLIPSKYTCDGENMNPPLMFSNIPPKAKSIALVVTDPDAPGGTFTHWIIYNIPATTTKIDENSVPEDSQEAQNSFGKKEYGGPCPPSGTHHYVFTLYALDSMISIPDSADVTDIEKVIQSNSMEQATLTGLYAKQ